MQLSAFTLPVAQRIADKIQLGRLLEIRDRGISVVLVEHDMNLVMSISDIIIVLNYGEKMASSIYPAEAVP